MLQELPKKEINYAHPSKGMLFWRVFCDLWRRAFIPLMMYLFMSITALACHAIGTDTLTWYKIALTILCIAAAGFFNGHLLYVTGKDHYDIYYVGKLHRRDERLGIPTDPRHRFDREYRPWKGFGIGLCIGAPVLLCGIVGAFTREFDFFALFLAGWAFMPIMWLRQTLVPDINTAWGLFFIILPVVLSGVFYLLGANKERGVKEAAAARAAEVMRLQEEQKRAAEERERQRLEAKRKKKEEAAEEPKKKK